MTNLIWTLDNKGRLTATWNTPPASESFAARWAAVDMDRRIVRTLVEAGAASHRLSRAAALAAYFRIQAAFGRHELA